MRLFSWNVNGLRAVYGRGDLLRFIESYDPDVLCMQEIKISEKDIEKSGIAEDFDSYKQIYSTAKKAGYAGTAIWIKKKYSKKLDKVFHGITEVVAKKNELFSDAYGDITSEGRITGIELPELYLVTAYSPHSKRDLSRVEFKEKNWNPALLEFLQELEKEKPVVLCGDLNVAHTAIDLANPKQNEKNAGFTQEEREGFEKFLAAGFIDSFRYFHPDKLGAYTWWTWRAKARERNVGWRIDYFLVSENGKDLMGDADIYQNVPGSDHCPVSLKIKEV